MGGAFLSLWRRAAKLAVQCYSAITITKTRVFVGLRRDRCGWVAQGREGVGQPAQSQHSHSTATDTVPAIVTAWSPQCTTTAAETVSSGRRTTVCSVFSPLSTGLAGVQDRDRDQSPARENRWREDANQLYSTVRPPQKGLLGLVGFPILQIDS